MFHWASQTTPNATGPTRQLCIFDLLLPSIQLLTRQPLKHFLHWISTTNSSSQSNLSITSSTNTHFFPPAVTSRDAITGNCWHHTTIPHSTHRGTGDRAYAAGITEGPAIGEDCLSLILGNQTRDLILTIHLAEIGQWYTGSTRMMLLLSPPAQQRSGPGFLCPCSFAEARGIKGKLRQLLQDYPSKAGGEDKPKAFSEANTPVL